jgi:hypothetical protein
VDAASVLLKLNVAQLAAPAERRMRRTTPSEPAAPHVTESNCMVAATMSLELHGCGIHAV